MKKDDATEKMQFIEEKYDVEKIKYEDYEIWPFIRVDLWFKYAAQNLVADSKNTHYSHGLSKIKKRTVGFVNKVRETNLYEYARKAKIILITDDWECKSYKGAIVDKTTSGFYELYDSNISPIILVDEKAKEHAYKRIIHFGLVMSMAKFSGVQYDYSKLRGREVFARILKELNIEYDIDQTVINILKSVKYFSRLFRQKHTEALFVNDYYNFDTMCAVYAARLMGIKTAEFQHGTISDYMFPYHAYKKFDFLNVPEFLLSYGDAFKKNAGGSVYDYSKIYVVGKYYIDLLRNDNDYLSRIGKKYPDYKSRIFITVAGQPTIENKMLEFTDLLAKLLPEMVFLYVPRRMDEIKFQKSSSNVIIESEYSIYHCMMISKSTITVSSTAGYESLALGTPLLIIDVGGRGKITYESTLKNVLSAKYAEELHEAKEAILQLVEIDNEQVKRDGNAFFAENHMSLLENACREIMEN